jgi:hypothetical protein
MRPPAFTIRPLWTQISPHLISCECCKLFRSGELAGIRTQDPRLKRALLYLLSYELTGKSRFFKTNIKMTFGGLVRQHLMM